MSDEFIFHGSIADLDPNLRRLLDLEDQRQRETIILIPSESMSPDAVREAMSSRFGNIYAEGYPREESRRQTEAEILDIDQELAHYHRYSDPRYYKGVEFADLLEALTRRRAAELFAANGLSAGQIYVNVQPLSGAPANSAVYTALLEPGDTLMGLNLDDGGHLSHGSKVNRSGKIYNPVSYFVDPETETLDYDAIEQIALAARPKIIVAGYSAYPHIVDWARFRAIADQCGAYLLADIAHISGLVAAGVHPSPIGIADVVTTTTHKTLRGPRGGLILMKEEHAKAINSAIFPGLQGGPLMHVIAAKATAFKEAMKPTFKNYQEQVIANARVMARVLGEERGLRIVSGGTESHVFLVDLRNKHVTGKVAEAALGMAHITVNKNAIPNDPEKPFVTSGIRLGSPAMTTRGFTEIEAEKIAHLVADVLDAPDDVANLERVRAQVSALCAKFPVYGD